jgi:hypothetical protein
MNGTPWMKFYPADYLNDEALSFCSLAAQGLWMRMVCIMHRAKPYGHLLVNGQPVTDAMLAIVAGTTPDQIADLLRELEALAVFSRTQKGVIFSRRMTRDHRKANEGRKAAQKRWDAEKAKPETAQASDFAEEKGRPNRPPNGPPNGPPTTKNQNQNDSPYSPPRGDGDGFERFREAYPPRGDASDAEKPVRSAYDRQVDAGADPEALVTAAKAYAADCRKQRTKPQYVKSAAKFLNQGVWRQYTGKPRPAERSDAEWRTNMAFYRRTRTWPSSWGDEPGKPGCKVPAHVLAEFQEVPADA